MTQTQSIQRRKRSRPARAEEQHDRTQPAMQVAGVLELHPQGYGFLRDTAKGYLPSPIDTYVSASMVQRYALRVGALVKGRAEQVRSDAAPRLVEILEIEGKSPDEYRHVPLFDRLTPIHPEVPLRLETDSQQLSTRVLDLFAPIGKGQRALIVAPPRTERQCS